MIKVVTYHYHKCLRKVILFEKYFMNNGKLSITQVTDDIEMTINDFNIYV